MIGIALSLLAADPRPASGATKLLGVAMLVALMVVTSELARRPGMPRAIKRFRYTLRFRP